jgi:hypothetical protein
VQALFIAGTHGDDGVGGVVRDAEVALLIAALLFYYSSLCGGKPVATTEKAVVFPVMALWVTGCVVMEGAVAVALADIVIVVGEFEVLLTTEREPEELSLGPGESPPMMGVLCPAPRDFNPTQPETVKQVQRTPRKGAESEE